MTGITTPTCSTRSVWQLSARISGRGPPSPTPKSGPQREPFPTARRRMLMSREPSITRNTRNRLVWLGAAALLVASLLFGLAVWSKSGALGYPASVAALFGVTFLGVAFPVVNRAGEGFFGLWMRVGIWMV